MKILASTVVLVLLPACGDSEAASEVVDPVASQPTVPAPASDEVPAGDEAPNPAAVMGEIRDLGIRNLAAPQPNLLTAGQITEAQLRKLADLTAVRLINLRTEGERGTGWEEKVTGELGVPYVRLPIRGGDDINEANARKLGEIMEQRPSGAMDLVYCGGSYRVGALVGLKAHVVDGLPPPEALELGLAAGASRMQAVLKERLGLADDQGK